MDDYSAPSTKAGSMDTDLEQRLAFFEEAGAVDPDLCGFVRGELAMLDAQGFVLTEASAGMFATHLLMALQRVRDGEPLEEPQGAETVARELSAHPAAVESAHGLAARAAAQSKVELPVHEVNFVAM